jgi:hypothetical protein
VSDASEKRAEWDAYLARWRAAHEAYSRWIAEEYSRRRAAWEKVRRLARQRLLEAAQSLLIRDRQGRVDSVSARGRAAIRAFRRRQDRILSAVVIEGERIFGITGERDRMGIFIGGVDRGTRRIALAKLREAIRA